MGIVRRLCGDLSVKASFDELGTNSFFAFKCDFVEQIRSCEPALSNDWADKSIGMVLGVLGYARLSELLIQDSIRHDWGTLTSFASLAHWGSVTASESKEPSIPQPWRHKFDIS